MAKIKNTNIPNFYGEGYKKEVTLDNGEKYIIKNSNIPNYFGEGYQQEIVKKDSYGAGRTYGPISSFFGWLIGVPALIIVLIAIGIVGIMIIKATYLTISTIVEGFSSIY